MTQAYSAPRLATVAAARMIVASTVWVVAAPALSDVMFSLMTIVLALWAFMPVGDLVSKFTADVGWFDE